MHILFLKPTATAEIYTLSLHDALPISAVAAPGLLGDVRDQVVGLDLVGVAADVAAGAGDVPARPEDRKRTRLNSSHPSISYAVFLLKKKSTVHLSFVCTFKIFRILIFA